MKKYKKTGKGFALSDEGFPRIEEGNVNREFLQRL